MAPRKAKHRVRTPSICVYKLLSVACVTLFLVPLLVTTSGGIRPFLRSWVVDNDEWIASTASRPVQKLIEALREATRKASGGHPVEFTDADRKAWEETNPCRSRLELLAMYAQRKHIKDVPSNKQWNLVFREYEKLHRTCISRIGDLRQYLINQNTSLGCKFVVAETHFGLGNKLYHLSSVFMFAVLRQRVLLIPEDSNIPAIMCQPFAGSSWTVDAELHEAVKERRATSVQFFEGVDRDIDHRGTLDMYVSEMDDWWGPERRFFCNTEQRFMSTVTWLTMDGCLLFLHKLFAVDMFRPALEDLFPNKIVFTYVLRSLMLPGDSVWERILHVNELYLGNADKQVGMNIRYHHELKEFEEKNELINDRVTRCVWENNILPEVCPASAGGASAEDPAYADAKFANCSRKLTVEDHKRPRLTKVVIACLFQGLQEHLDSIYLRHEMTTTKEVVGIYQLTHELIQGSGVEVDSQALVEIISLSLSDVLLVSPMSTFGGSAQAYGGIVPWFIEFNKNKGEPDQCQRAQAIEPCYLGARRDYDCRHDSAGTQHILDLFPYLTECLLIDVRDGLGMQMIPESLDKVDFSIT